MNAKNHPGVYGDLFLYKCKKTKRFMETTKLISHEK